MYQRETFQEREVREKRDVETYWNNYKYAMPNYPLLSMRFNGNLFQVSKEGKVWSNAGYISDMAIFGQERFYNHVHNVLFGESLYQENKEVQMDNTAFDTLMKRAKETGDLFGQVQVAIAPDRDIPNMLMYKFTSAIGKVCGFTDTDSNDAFKFAWMQAVDNYKQSNRNHTKVLDTYREVQG